MTQRKSTSVQILISLLAGILFSCAGEHTNEVVTTKRFDTSIQPTSEAGVVEQNVLLEDKMDALYRDYRKLQRYAFNEKLFHKPESQDEVTRLLDRMLRHSPDASQYSRSMIGFQTSLDIFKDNLRDVNRRMKEGNVEYAYWQIGSVFNQCVSCHMMYGDKQVEAKRIAPASNGMNTLDRARYYIAAHSFQKAEKELEDLIVSDSDVNLIFQAYKQLLVIVTRMYPPGEAAERLSSLRPGLSLDDKQHTAIMDWISYLQSQSNISLESLDAVRDQIRKAEALGVDNELNKQTVAYMISVWSLHDMLQQWDFNGRKRREALLLLGKSYKNLPFYFDSGLAEQFLEQCIREYPGTAESRQAYQLLEDAIVLRFTGSSGVILPNDVKKKLQRLSSKAVRGES